jgi:hypothetical protein
MRPLPVLDGHAGRQLSPPRLLHLNLFAAIVVPNFVSRPARKLRATGTIGLEPKIASQRANASRLRLDRIECIDTGQLHIEFCASIFVEQDQGATFFSTGKLLRRQITSDFQKSRQAPGAKIFRLTCRANQSHNSARLVADEGRWPSSRTRGEMRWTLMALDVRAGSVRRSRVVRASRCWR